MVKENVQSVRSSGFLMKIR